MTPFEDHFPFRTRLSLAPLHAYWREVADSDSLLRSRLARELLGLFEEFPELIAPIDDVESLSRHKETIGQMMELVLPWSLGTDTHVAVIPPFDLDTIFASAEFRRLDLTGALKEKLVAGGDMMKLGKAMTAYHYALSELYNIENDWFFSGLVTVPDGNTGLDRSFKLTFDTRFCSVQFDGDLPGLTEEDLRRMKSERMNYELWKQILPPEKISIDGFAVVTAVDVTEQEMISLLERDLLQKDAMDSTEKLDRLQHRIRSLLGLKDLQLGLICLEEGEMEGAAGVRPVARSLLLTDAIQVPYEEFEASIYKRMCSSGQPVVVNDLAEQDRSWFEDALYRKGIRNVAIMPLQFEDQFIGVLELGSPNAGDLHPLNVIKLADVYSLIATALKRILDEREIRIQAVIKKHYTAIHPAVEWRFREAARNLLEQREEGVAAKPEQIVFRDVYSLYGLSDIRGSSTERNRSIKADLLQQLQLAHAVISDAARTRSLPILDELGYRIVQKISEIEDDLHSGDEARVLEFLRQEVEALLPQLEKFSDSVQRRVDTYRQALDPQLGVLYDQRKDYEQSVTLINDTISDYIDRHAGEAQKIFPHYFEKYKTDGVDYNIYVGASLQPKGEFNALYLRNFRLWQLTLTCGVHWELEKVRGQLKTPLEVAHLVLVQDTPIAIRFRIDEKQFDVDGAYNIRYEIVKKRIDKAFVKGTGDRLTQPGTIAIVYTQDHEAEEYRRYIEYLMAAGYLKGEVENLMLEDLQGVHGLRALRVAISPHVIVGEDSISLERAGKVSH